MGVIQALPTFLLLLLISSRFDARQIEYGDGPSPAPGDSCSRASWLALQGLGNMSRALSDIKAQPSGNLSAELLLAIGECLDSLIQAVGKIKLAMEEGPEQPPVYYYEPENRYEAAISLMGYCQIDDPIAQKLRTAYDVAVALISKARDLCL